jgi:hypothetical protein
MNKKQMFSMINNECSICEYELKDTDNVIITDCNHKFHRNCAQQRLDTKNKSHCPICKQDLAVANALSQDLMTKSIEEIDDSLEYVSLFLFN